MAFFTSSRLTSVLPSKAAMVFAVLLITISARWVFTPRSMQMPATERRRSSLMETLLRILRAWEIFSFNSIWLCRHFSANASGSESNASAILAICTLRSTSSMPETLTCNPNLSSNWGRISPSSGFMVPTSMNREGWATDTPSLSTILTPMAAESSSTSATWSSRRLTSSM